LILFISYIIFYFIDELIDLNEEDENEIYEYDKNEDDNLMEKDKDNDQVEKESINQFGK
jgi:hypothetical protein